jgi:hypothetical protein
MFLMKPRDDRENSSERVEAWPLSVRVPRSLLQRALFSSLLVFISIPFSSQGVLAQISQATISEIVGGDAVFIQESRAQVSDVANFQESVRTEVARTELAFNNGAAGRLEANSSLIVGQCVELRQGQLLVSGPANGCVAGFEVGTQGTIYLLEANAAGEGSVKVLEGEISLFPRKPDGLGEPPILVRQGERIQILGGDRLGVVERIRDRDFAQIITGRLFRGFRRPLPGQEKLRKVCQDLFPDFDCPDVRGFPPPLKPPRE